MVISQGNTELLAKIVLAAMSLVGATSVVAGLWLQDQPRSILADESKEDDFEMCLNLLTGAGVGLFIASFIIILFVFNSGISRILDNQNYTIYLVLCAIFGGIIIGLSQYINDLIDNSKEEDGFKASHFLTINLVLGIVCLLVALAMLALINNYAVEDDSEFDAGFDNNFGFDFEF